MTVTTTGHQSLPLAQQPNTAPDSSAVSPALTAATAETATLYYCGTALAGYWVPRSPHFLNYMNSTKVIILNVTTLSFTYCCTMDSHADRHTPGEEPALLPVNYTTNKNHCTAFTTLYLLRCRMWVQNRVKSCAHWPYAHVLIFSCIPYFPTAHAP